MVKTITLGYPEQAVTVFMTVCSTRREFLREWRKYPSDAYTRSARGFKAFCWEGVDSLKGLQVYVVIHQTSGNEALTDYIVHEISHAADVIYKYFNKRKKLNNVIKDEFKAYVHGDLYRLFENWRRSKFKEQGRRHKWLLRGLRHVVENYKSLCA